MATAAKKTRRRPQVLPIETSLPAQKGRPPAPYHESYADRAKTLSIAGFTHERMAEIFGIAINTFRKWCDENEAFMSAVKFGTDLADAQIERSLYERARGYSHPDVDIRTVALGENQGSEIVMTPITKHYPPDSTSIIFWMANRQRARYRRGDVDGVDPNQTPEAIAKAAQAAISAIDTDEGGP